MNHVDIIATLSFIRPNAQYALRGEDLQWLDSEQVEPTKDELELGWLQYQEHAATVAAEKAAARQALLDKLGITEDEARLLLS